MDVSTQKQGNQLVVGLNGRLDSNTSPQFEKQLMGWIQQGEHNLVLDFSRLTYISSAGLRVLLMGAKRAKQAKGSIALAGMRPNIQEVFKISGFLQIFPTFPDVAAAARP